MSLGIMSIAIVSILGLIGTTLTDVRQTSDISAGTTCIGKMNAILANTVFYDPRERDESVYYWLINSAQDSPTVFLFYDENPANNTGVAGSAPMPRVVRFNANFQELNTPSTSYAINAQNPQVPQLPVYETLTDFVAAVTGGRVSGTVIAMTLSISPLMKNFPKSILGPDGDETQYYNDPPTGQLFPIVGRMPQDPNGLSGDIYPEDYLPIYVQAFTISITNIQSGMDSNTLARLILDNLTAGNRLFTYTTAKLR